jgi:hypothetical protein
MHPKVATPRTCLTQIDELDESLLDSVVGGEEKTAGTFFRDFVVPNTAAWVTTVPCFAGAAAAVRKVKNPWIRWGVPLAADLVCDYATGAATYFGLSDKLKPSTPDKPAK